MEKQSLKLNRKILSKEKEIEVALDFIVPDVKPDIITIFDTNANVYIYKEEILENRIRLEGNIDSYVVYLSGDGDTRSMSINMNFNEEINDNLITTNLNYKTNIEIIEIETKILNERKINVVAKCIIRAEFYENTNLDLLVASEDDSNIDFIKRAIENGFDKRKTIDAVFISHHDTLEHGLSAHFT